ncbi:MAG: ABC transporter ATP-binding protein [Solibacillus sp.]
MISCQHVRKSYKTDILTDVTFSIEEPKIIGLTGRNGVGKSTLFKLLAGHSKVTSGDIKLFGEQPFNNLFVAANTILIDEKMTFPSTLSLGNILKQAKRFYPNFALARARSLADYAKLPLKSYHQHLSRGQRATFNLIYALCTRCAVTLLDEPMNGMDEAIRDDFYRAILKEFMEAPRVIIISSHHLSEMEHLLEDIILLDDGVVKKHDAIEVFQQYAMRVRGMKEEMEPLLLGETVLAKKQNGPFYEVIIEASGKRALQEKGHYLSASETCKLLTEKSQGGIDDVFREA